MTDQTAIVQTSTMFLAPAATLNTVLMAYQAKKEFIEQVLKPKVDFGTIPGSDKNTLLKPGAEKMTSFFGMAPDFEDVITVEDWTGAEHGGEQFFYYRQKCKLFLGNRLIASADGSCNSFEKKYRYRNADRACPQCGKAAIKRSKYPPRGAPADTPPGWYCYDKLGGCGANFTANAPEIIGQQLGQIKNPDVAEQVNTILKMAQKRALVAAVLIATGTSEYFTQDIEDFTPDDITDTTFTIVPPEPVVPEPPTPASKQPAQPSNTNVSPAQEQFSAPQMVKIGKKLYPAEWGKAFIPMYPIHSAFEIDGILQKLQLPEGTRAELAVACVGVYLTSKQNGDDDPTQAANDYYTAAVNGMTENG